MEESAEEESLEFKWGKKRGIGGKKKDVQFYESFTYDGDEYRLYDCVLVGDGSEPESEPFVGMIIKIWEHTDKPAIPKKVKLLWFFKPSEIEQHLEGVPDVLPNELFLASGEGSGVANVNPLEAIGGKCSILCISKDERNPQPSDENVNSADFVFRRAFDVGSCKVLDKLDDKVAGVDVKRIFNRAGCKNEATAVQKIEADINGNPDSLKPNGPSASDPVRKIEDNSVEAVLNGSPHSLKPNGPSASGSVRKTEDNSVEADLKESLDSLKPNGPSASCPVRKTEDNSVEADLNGSKPNGPSACDSVRKTEDNFVEADSKGNPGSLRPNGLSACGLVRKTKVNSVEADLKGIPDSLKPNGPSASGQVRRTEDNSAEACLNGSPDSLKPNGPSATGPVRKTEDNSTESSGCRESRHGFKEGKEKAHNQLATKKSRLAEERSNKDSGETSGSRGNQCDGKAQESEVKKHFSKQKSMPAEERYRNSREASGSRVNPSKSKKAQVDDVKKQLTKQKSMPAEARYSRESNGLDDKPQKKQKLDGSVAVPDGRNTTNLQNISSDSKKGTASFKRPRDKVTREEVSPENPSFVKKRNLGVSASEGKDTKTAIEKGLSKRPNSDGKLKRADDKMLADDNERNYQVIKVSRKPDAGKSKWFRPLPWEERMREAETLETLVLLQNLDPTYTSAEVEDIVYSALNEQCTARMIQRTSATTPHIGQALVIFNSKEAAEKAIRRLDEGCLLLSNGRPLVAAFAKINRPGKLSPFPGHIKLLKTQMRREMRDALSTSHHSQPNTLENDMAMEWCLHQARCKLATERVFKRQMEEKKSMRINFKPKLP